MLSQPHSSEYFQKNQIGWTVLSNHGHVLVCLARDPAMRLRDVALRVGITERAVQRIVSDLQAAGFLSISKSGRCNSYEILTDNPLKHPLESNRTVGDLLKLFS